MIEHKLPQSILDDIKVGDHVFTNKGQSLRVHLRDNEMVYDNANRGYNVEDIRRVSFKRDEFYIEVERNG